MATFSVFFFGLITHVGQSDYSKSHAAIVDAQSTQHLPLIIINGAPKRLRKGDSISFGVPSGDVTTDAEFVRYVPGLRAMLLGNNDLRDEIKSRTSDSDVFGYVTYPTGVLKVADLFD